MKRQYTVLDSDGMNRGEFDDLDAATNRADEIMGYPDSPESRRARQFRTGDCVYTVGSDQMQSPHGAQVNKNW